jgi:adenine-specific DNA-methyltransferase
VATYRNAESKEEKREMERLIENIKTDFRSEIESPFKKKISDARGKADALAVKILNLKTFGEKADKQMLADHEKAVEALAKLEKERDEVIANKIYENAFEWRFEFPEVLNDEGDFVGFDVVIGNPPYIRQEGITELKPYLEANFTTYSGRADLYVYFYEKGVSIIKPNGIFCFITPNKFFRANYGKALKIYLATHLNIKKIIDFGELPVFEEASTFPMIFLSQKTNSIRTDIEYAQVKELTSVKENVFNSFKSYSNLLSSDNINNENWNLNQGDSSDLFNRLISENKLLKLINDINIYSGIKTGFNNAFWINDEIKNRLVSEDPKSIEIIKPLCRGTDIRKWQVTNENLNIIFTHNEILIDNYPAVKKYLFAFKEKLEQRSVQQPWWQLQQAQNRDGIWDNPKILYPDICKESRFTLDEKAIYSDMKGFVLTSSSKLLLAILNSKVVWWYLKQICAVLGDPEKGGRLQLKSQYIERIPIADCSDLNTKNKIELLVEKCLQKPNDCIQLEVEINQLVYKLYKLTEEEINIIEKV